MIVRTVKAKGVFGLSAVLIFPAATVFAQIPPPPPPPVPAARAAPVAQQVNKAPTNAPVAVTGHPVQVQPPAPVPGTLQAALAGALDVAAPKVNVDDFAAAKAFYVGRGYATLWVDHRGLKGDAEAIMAELRRADEWGLAASDFALPALPRGGASLEGLAQAELTLTTAVLTYARHARGGRIPDPSAMLSGYIDRKPQLIAPQTVLEQIASARPADAYLRGLHPQHREFAALREALLAARPPQQGTKKVHIPAGPLLMLGKSHPHVALLRERLGVPVPASAPAVADPAQYFDAELAKAVKAFQSSAKVQADAMVGERTRNFLNGAGTNDPTQVAKLIANMEQWRWMPADLGSSHVAVNIPEAQVRLVRDGQVVHSERVIVGKLQTATPVFSDHLQSIVFQPRWGVPDSIKVNEFLPRLQNGRGLRANFKMMLGTKEVDPDSVDWFKADITKYHIYQPSGDDNALGAVKFLFPNKHAVYLHDTPNKSLFGSESRLFSHGCVRVRNPVRLAELLLSHDKGWNRSLINELVDSGPEDNKIRLDQKMPIHLTYFTATVDTAGKVNTAPDVYGHERRITLALAGRASEIKRLDPAPLGDGAPVASAGEPVDKQRRRTAQAQAPAFAQPSGLGYISTVPAPVVTFLKPSSPSPRSRGTTSNDIIMRQLGGF